MASRLIAQLLVMGTQVVVKAFAEAYKQAIANAGRGGAAAASNEAGTLIRRGVMSLDEASRILNVDKTATPDALRRPFEHLFKVNDRSVGGSFYLQSKVVRAKERFEMEWKERGIKFEPIREPEIAREKPASDAAAGSTGASKADPGSTGASKE